MLVLNRCLEYEYLYQTTKLAQKAWPCEHIKSVTVSLEVCIILLVSHISGCLPAWLNKEPVNVWLACYIKMLVMDKPTQEIQFKDLC